MNMTKSLKKELRKAEYEAGRQDGIEIGRQDGIEIGRQDGIEIGRQDGIEIGKRILLEKIIKKKLKKEINRTDSR